MLKSKSEIIWAHTPNSEYPSYWHETDIEQMMDEWGKSQCVAFAEFINEARGDEGEVYINKNPFGIKPGYYTSESLFNLFAKQQSV